MMIIHCGLYDQLNDGWSCIIFQFTLDSLYMVFDEENQRFSQKKKFNLTIIVELNITDI